MEQFLLWACVCRSMCDHFSVGSNVLLLHWSLSVASVIWDHHEIVWALVALKWADQPLIEQSFRSGISWNHLHDLLCRCSYNRDQLCTAYCSVSLLVLTIAAPRCNQDGAPPLAEDVVIEDVEMEDVSSFSFSHSARLLFRDDLCVYQLQFQWSYSEETPMRLGKTREAQRSTRSGCLVAVGWRRGYRSC